MNERIFSNFAVRLMMTNIFASMTSVVSIRTREIRNQTFERFYSGDNSDGFIISGTRDLP